MRKKPKSGSVARLNPRLRVMHGDEIALGPGKVELLAAVAETGSITAAAKRLNMSYMRAWILIRTMNRCFKEPLVASNRGGSTHGGAGLTPAGLDVFKLYQRMDRECTAALGQRWRELKKFLRK